MDNPRINQMEAILSEDRRLACHLRDEVKAETPTPEEIRAARYTAKQLGLWGIPWPPPKGWRRNLLKHATTVHNGLTTD